MAKSNPDDKDYNAGFIIIIFFSLISATLVFLLANPIANLMNSDGVGYALQWISLIILTFGLARIHEVWLAKNMKFKQLAIRSIITILVGGAVGVYLATQGYGIKSLIAQQLTTTSLSVIFLWVTTEWQPRFNTTKSKLKSIVDFGRMISFNNVTSLLSSQVDIFFAGFFLGTAQTGVYSTAKRIILAVMMIVASSVNSVFLPSVVAANESQIKVKDTFLMFIKFSSLIIVPILLGLAGLSSPFILILLGDGWSDVAPIVTIACFYSVIAKYEYFNVNIILAKNKTYLYSYLTISHLLLSVILIPIFVPYGINWLAYALLIKAMIVFPFSLKIALKLMQVKLQEYCSMVWPSLMSALIMYFGITIFQSFELFPHQTLLEFITLIPLAIALYVISMFIIKKEFLLDASHIVLKMLK